MRRTKKGMVIIRHMLGEPLGEPATTVSIGKPRGAPLRIDLLESDWHFPWIEPYVSEDIRG